jgi:hypothetical protein
MIFSIITPTTGNPLLARLLRSLNDLEIAPVHKIEHIVCVDGLAHEEKAREIFEDVPAAKHIARYVIFLPFTTGENNYLGHKIYAAVSQFARGDYVLFLDEDNMYEKKHIKNFYEILDYKRYDWVYSFRSILLPIGSGGKEKIVCEDLCESLGYLHPVWCDPKSQNFLVDTNCFCIRKDIIITCSPIYNAPGHNGANDPDRLLTRFLLQNFHNYTCTGEATLLYQTANREGSVNAKFFLEGNKQMKQLYRSPKAWSKPMLYLAHFDIDHTQQVVDRLYETTHPRSCVSWFQWQLNLCDRLTDHFWVKNAYTNPMPSGSNVLFHLCDPNQLPVDLLKRKDIRKIVTTIESPNIRHREQWSAKFLTTCFTHIITYWEPLLQKFPACTSYFPFVSRTDTTNLNDTAYLDQTREVTPRPHTVCLVLQNRDFKGSYTIDGFEDVTLKALDWKRAVYATELGKKCHCYGESWKSLEDTVTYRQAKDRFLDIEFTVNLYAEHSFALVIENTDADGYVSEKLYDALIAGAIPLYYGNVNDRLGIPPDSYIDIKCMTPSEVANLVNNLSEEDVLEKRKKIVELRENILRQSSVDAYAAKVLNIVKGN